MLAVVSAVAMVGGLFKGKSLLSSSSSSSCHLAARGLVWRLTHPTALWLTTLLHEAGKHPIEQWTVSEKERGGDRRVIVPFLCMPLTLSHYPVQDLAHVTRMPCPGALEADQTLNINEKLQCNLFIAYCQFWYRVDNKTTFTHTCTTVILCNLPFT